MADVSGGDAENVVLDIIQEVKYLNIGNDLGGFLITEIATVSPKAHFEHISC
jgi:hypothetical protein